MNRTYLEIIETSRGIPTVEMPSGIYLDKSTQNVWAKGGNAPAFYIGMLNTFKTIDEMQSKTEVNTISEQTLLKTLAIALKPELGANLFK